MDFMHSFGPGMGYQDPVGSVFFVPLLILLAWNLVWKGLALWRAVNRCDTWWFVAFLVFNTLGILEIIYLFVFSGAKLSDFTKGFSRKGDKR